MTTLHNLKDLGLLTAFTREHESKSNSLRTNLQAKLPSDFCLQGYQYEYKTLNNLYPKEDGRVSDVWVWYAHRDTSGAWTESHGSLRK